MAVTSVGKPFINQHNDPPVCLRANDPAGGLQHPVKARILVSVGKTTDVLAIKIRFD